MIVTCIFDSFDNDNIGIKNDFSHKIFDGGKQDYLYTSLIKKFFRLLVTKYLMESCWLHNVLIE